MSKHFEADFNVAAVIKSSLVFGLLDRALSSVWRAASSSVAVSISTEAASAWTGLDTRDRRVAVGMMLVVAVATHILLTLVTEVPPGWLWLVLPGVVGAVGLLLVAAPGLRGMTRR